jgi:hypothetical protein
MSLSFLVKAKIFRSVLLFFVEMLRDKQFWAEIFIDGKQLWGVAANCSFVASNVRYMG